MNDPLLDDPPTLFEKLRTMQDDATRQMKPWWKSDLAWAR